jgi:[citrate (pro-3S)-lyase] ligase
MEINYGFPFIGRERERVEEFLSRFRLDYEEEIGFTVNLLEGDDIVATGSRRGNVLECIAVSPEFRGRDLAAVVVTELVREAVAQKIDHLFLFTVPENKRIFTGLGFWTIVESSEALLMENRKDGLAGFINRLDCPTKSGVIGCVIANCNPFTNGHLYLIEAATRECDLLHLFILSEDRSLFSSRERLALAKKCTVHLDNVVVHPTEDYLLSFATFPTYFIKDKAQVEQINCTLDLLIFTEIIAGALNITKRFVGAEPFDPVTNFYNRRLHEVLPKYGISLIELPRRTSRVRQIIAAGEFANIGCLVPSATYEYILNKYGQVK